MRMRAFKSHGMNRVIARAVSHAVNDHYRYNRRSSYTSSSSDTSAGSLAIMFFCLFFILAACGAM
jgi:hypothetical protein